jgi:2-keto-3-deoxy-L-rhamnonate aldolase RhmA
MLRPNKIKQALARGEPVIGTMVSETSATGYIWTLANLGYDFVFIDLEHGAFTLPAVADMVKVARLSGIVPIVRVPDLAYHVVGPVLDVGAMGLMLPRVETRAQVEQLVSFMKYPPLGVRGASSGRGHTDYVGTGPRELVSHMNEHTLVVLQIERRRAVEDIDSLLSVPGVDVALIGPFDLTISLGEASTTAPAVEAAIQLVVDAAKRQGVASGIDAHDPEVVLGWRRRGMTMLSSGSDLGFFSAGARQSLGVLREGIGGARTGDLDAGPAVNV